MADKCVRADATLYCAGVTTYVYGLAPWSNSPSVTR